MEVDDACDIGPSQRDGKQLRVQVPWEWYQHEASKLDRDMCTAGSKRKRFSYLKCRAVQWVWFEHCALASSLLMWMCKY
eukprot:3839068-Pleurochrysis_carterae.AAC.3